MNISWQLACNNAPKLPDKDFITKCLEQAFTKTKVSITIRFVDKAESQQLNCEFRNKDKPTNVLSFPDQAIPGEQEPEIGALVFCPDIISSEVKCSNSDFHAYWAHMIIHGSLHLLGFTHENTTNAEKMESIEASILEKLGYPNPYA